MLNVIAGRLSEDVKVRQTPSGTYVCNTNIYVWPGKRGTGKEAPDRDSIPVKIEAWGAEAKEMEKYKKGDTIQFVGKVIDVKYKPTGLDRELTVMGYEVKRIDHNKTILSEFNEILSDYAYENKQKNMDESKTEEKNKKREESNEGNKTLDNSKENIVKDMGLGPAI